MAVAALAKIRIGRPFASVMHLCSHAGCAVVSEASGAAADPGCVEGIPLYPTIPEVQSPPQGSIALTVASRPCVRSVSR
jgi:hypothetical protein